MTRLLPFALALLTGCIVNEVAAGVGANRTSPWYETGPVQKTRAELIGTVRELITRCGYHAPDTGAAAEKIETDWDVKMSPRYRESFRTKLEIEIVPAQNGALNVRTRSWMEVNNNSNHPSDEDRAVWVGAGVADRHKDRIDEPAMRFHSMLKVKVFGLH